MRLEKFVTTIETLDRLGEPALLIGLDGSILDANPAALSCYGYSHDEILALNVRDLRAPRDRESAIDHYRQAAESGALFQALALRKDGTFFPIEVQAIPIGIDGKTVLLSLVSDVTEREQAKEALRDLASRIESVIEGSRLGTWEWDVQTGEVTFNERWAEIIGHTLEELAPISIKTWEALAHPDDLARSEELLQRHFAGELPYYVFESRMKHKDGHWIWILDRGRTFSRSHDGKPLMMFGTHTDITASKQAEEALRESEEKYRIVADFTSDWEAWTGPDGEYRYVSPSCERIAGHTAAEFIDDPRLLERIVHPDDRSEVIEHFYAVRHGARDEDGALEFRILTANGETRWISHMCTAVFGEDGQWLGRRESNRDITVRKLLEEKLQLRATTDDLTGVANRREFLRLAQGELKRAVRHQESIAIVFVDVDCLKDVNDGYGHAVGDRALISVVSVCKKCIREIDVLARVGGDEFALMLPATTRDEAYATVERVRVALTAETIEVVGAHLSISISAGVAALSGDQETLDMLLRRADQAMYQAKETGRNRTVVDASTGWPPV